MENNRKASEMKNKRLVSVLLFRSDSTSFIKDSELRCYLVILISVSASNYDIFLVIMRYGSRNFVKL